MDICWRFLFTLRLDVLVAAGPTLANGQLVLLLLLPLLMWRVVVGEGDSGPRNLVENLMICNTLALGLQDCK